LVPLFFAELLVPQGNLSNVMIPKELEKIRPVEINLVNHGLNFKRIKT